MNNQEDEPLQAVDVKHIALSPISKARLAWKIRQSNLQALPPDKAIELLAAHMLWLEEADMRYELKKIELELSETVKKAEVNAKDGLFASSLQVMDCLGGALKETNEMRLMNLKVAEEQMEKNIEVIGVLHQRRSKDKAKSDQALDGRHKKNRSDKAKFFAWMDENRDKHQQNKKAIAQAEEDLNLKTKDNDDYAFGTLSDWYYEWQKNRGSA